MALPWLMIFGLATSLIQLVQQIWPSGTGKGQVKKDVVMGTVEAAVNTVGAVLTGGAQKTFQEMGGREVISDFIEQMVTTLFKDKVVDPQADMTAAEKAGMPAKSQ